MILLGLRTLDMHRLSNFETQLRLVQRNMIRVLNFPTEVDIDAAPARHSFKRRTAPDEPRQATFPTMPQFAPMK